MTKPFGVRVEHSEQLPGTPRQRVKSFQASLRFLGVPVAGFGACLGGVATFLLIRGPSLPAALAAGAATVALGATTIGLMVSGVRLQREALQDDGENQEGK